MSAKRKPNPLLVRQATAYRRLAAKAHKNGRHSEWKAHSERADRLMAQHYRAEARKAERAEQAAAYAARKP